MKKYYVKLGDFDASKISFMSIVNEPATEENFLKFTLLQKKQ